MKIEELLFQLVKEFDKGYFNGVGCVIGVSFKRFAWDWKEGTVTFGCYNQDTRMIYLNEFFRKPIKYGMFQKEIKSILFHELVHGVIVNSLQPVRFRMFRDYARNGDYHGPEFRRLEASYPEKFTEKEMAEVGPQILRWMVQQSGPKE